MTNGYEPKPPEFNVNFLMNKSYILIGIGIVVFIIASSLSFFTVKANQEAVILRFGKYNETVGPGLHFKLPVIDNVLSGEVKRIYNEEFGFRTRYSGKISTFDYDFPGAQDEPALQGQGREDPLRPHAERKRSRAPADRDLPSRDAPAQRRHGGGPRAAPPVHGRRRDCAPRENGVTAPPSAGVH